MLRLTQAAALAANGELEKATDEFASLVDSRIKFGQFIHELTNKLLLGGQNESAENIVNISGKLKELR